MFGLDFCLSLQHFDSCTMPKDRLLYVLGSRLSGRFHPENIREPFDLSSFPLSTATFASMAEVYDKGFSRSHAKVWKSDIAVKDVRPMD
jgi:hypothetical protein